MARGRARAKQSKCDVQRALALLRPLAMVEQKFAWDGTSYEKRSRSLGPDRPKLDDASPFLTVLAIMAPNGVPALALHSI